MRGPGINPSTFLMIFLLKYEVVEENQRACRPINVLCHRTQLEILSCAAWSNNRLFSAQSGVQKYQLELIIVVVTQKQIYLPE